MTDGRFTPIAAPLLGYRLTVSIDTGVGSVEYAAESSLPDALAALSRETGVPVARLEISTMCAIWDDAGAASEMPTTTVYNVYDSTSGATRRDRRLVGRVRHDAPAAPAVADPGGES